MLTSAEQSLRRVYNLILIIVSDDRGVYRTDTCATHRGQKRRSPPKGRIHLRRLVFSPKLTLAVARRTYVIGIDPALGRLTVAEVELR